MARGSSGSPSMDTLVTSSISIVAPTFEQHHNGFGVQFPRPRISWRFSDADKQVFDWVQTAYDLEVRHGDTDLSQFVHVDSESSVLVPWPPECSALKSRERRHVRVRCYGTCRRDEGDAWENVTERSRWSDWSMVEAALLEGDDWLASMITPIEQPPLNDNGSARPLAFQKRFFLPSDRDIERARLYATSHGAYYASLNGQQVGDHCMSPGWQSYKKRLHYQVYDIGSLLQAGVENILQFNVGPGWFASALSWDSRRFCYGTELGVLAQLEVKLGGSDKLFVVCTDPSWSATTSAILSSEIYNGEEYDQRRAARISGANTKLAQNIWSGTRVSSTPVAPLTSPNAPPVRVTQHLTPKSIFKSASGKWVIDFGQNIAGRVGIKRLLKPAGHKVTFRHAEVMEDGELGTRPLRRAKATDTVICDGTLLVDYHPKFTFHGFRYVEVTGWSPEDAGMPLGVDSIVAEVIHSNMRRTGWFSCSNDEVNRLHENALWGMRGNFVSIPSECPSRDERFGWTGDANVFAPAATFFYDTAGMLGDWLQDLYADQMDEHEYWQKGVVPLFVPNCLANISPEDHGWDPMPNGVWSDASIMIPWQLYHTSGDVNILSRQYDSMVQYLENGVRRGNDGLWDPYQWQFGDWLDPNAPTNDSGRGRTDGTFVADCYLIQSTKIIVLIAKQLQKSNDCARFDSAYRQLLAAFQKKYLTQAGLVTPDTPTALALVIAFDLLPYSETSSPLPTQHAAAERLSRALRINDFRIPTGFVGTAHLLHSLTSVDQDNLAYTMLLSRSIPSLLYPVRMGATTIWERWDSLKPDGRINEGSMTSFNHHALGAVVSWLHECVGGIKAGRSGWKTILIKPSVNRVLSHAEVVYDSVYGRVQCRWKLDGNALSIDITVPPNTRALIVLPDEGNKGGAHGLEDNGRWVGSGRYHFNSEYKRADQPVEAMLPPWGRSDF